MKKLLGMIAIAILVPNNIGSNAADINMEIKSKIEIKKYWGLNFNAKTPCSWKQVSIASRYNNPGNLRSVYTGRFRKFNTLEEGYYALLDDINMKKNGKSRYCDSTTTVRDFIYIYAPPFENNTKMYVHNLCTDLGIDDSNVIGSIPTNDLARAIIKIEDPILYNELFVEIEFANTVYYYEEN